jgi:hypothetical protein
MRKIIPVVVLTIILATVGFWAGRRYLHMAYISLFIKAPPEKKFMDAWESDIHHLDDIKALPPGFKDLRLVRLSTPSAKLKKSFKQYPIQFEAKPSGHFILEIFGDELDEGGVLIQYDLVDGKTGNTVWELGRTFPQKL